MKESTEKLTFLDHCLRSPWGLKFNDFIIRTFKGDGKGWVPPLNFGNISNVTEDFGIQM